MKILVLDAMGVIYRARDDVAELLVPFVRAHGGEQEHAVIEATYGAASHGRISAEELWRRLGVDPALEDGYLAGHALNEGLLEFLEWAAPRFDEIVCLSNDVSEWSVKLRTRFGLERYISQWFISGDMHARKPQPEAYERMLAGTGAPPEQVIFVDDNLSNVLAARELGIQAIQFHPTAAGEAGIRVVRDFADLASLLLGGRS